LHSDLSAVYEKRGMGKEALASAEEAVRLNPNYPEAHNQLGVVYLSQARAQEALLPLQRAQSLDPDNPVYMRNLIKVLGRTGNHKETMALYREIAKNPRSLLALNF